MDKASISSKNQKQHVLAFQKEAETTGTSFSKEETQILAFQKAETESISFSEMLDKASIRFQKEGETESISFSKRRKNRY